MIRVSIKGDNGGKEQPYPKLMISKGGQIVLMFSPRVGTLLEGNGICGECVDYWEMGQFTDFDGSVELKNA